MIRPFRLLAVVSGFALVASALSAAAQEKIDPRVRVEADRKGASRVIIAFRKPSAGAPPSFAATMPQAYLSSFLGGGDARNVTRIASFPLASAELTSSGIEKLASDPNVLAVIKDEPVPHALSDTVPLIGANTASSKSFGGKGQAVAILDSGVELLHPQFAGKVLAEACFSTPASTVYQLESLCPNKLDVMVGAGAAKGCDQAVSGCDHGTHVSGIALGKGANHQGKTIRGVAPEASLFPVQVFTLFKDTSVCGSAAPCIRSFPSDQIKALAHVANIADSFPIASINMSLGGGYNRDNCDIANVVFTDAIETLFAKGVAVVVASGNESYFDGISQPACFTKVVSVTATRKPTATTAEAVDVSYANMSKDVDLAAPGSNIMSSVYGGYGLKSGTSMAAPHVAGAWAVLKSAKPSASVSEILAILKATGSRVTDPRTGLEVSRIAVDKALELLNQGGTAAVPIQSGSAPQLPAIEGARQIVIVPFQNDKIGQMTAQELESHLRSAPGGGTTTVRQQSIGGQSSFFIESATGVKADAFRELITPNTKIFDNTPSPLSK